MPCILSVRSMTGFARVRRMAGPVEIVFSLKSVNHRGLDLHFHMPAELDFAENDIRTVLKAGIIRGHVQIHVSLNRAMAAGAGALNRPLFDAYLRAFQEAASAADSCCIRLAWMRLIRAWSSET